MKVPAQLIASAVLVLGVAGGASAAVVAGSSYTVTYDDSVSFFGVADLTPEGSITWDLYGSGPSFDATQAKFVVGDGLSSLLALPSFTLAANPGYVINSASFNISGTGAARTFKWDGYFTGWVFTATSAPAFSFDVQGIIDQAVLPGAPLPVSGYSVLMRSDEGKIYATRATLTLNVSPAAAVPEPEQYLMLMSGLGVLAGMARRRSRRAAEQSPV